MAGRQVYVCILQWGVMYLFWSHSVTFLRLIWSAPSQEVVGTTTQSIFQYLVRVNPITGIVHVHTSTHRRLQTCVGIQARLGYPRFDAQLQRILSLHCTLYVRPYVRKHAYAIYRCLEACHVSSHPVLMIWEHEITQAMPRYAWACRRLCIHNSILWHLCVHVVKWHTCMHEDAQLTWLLDYMDHPDLVISTSHVCHCRCPLWASERGRICSWWLSQSRAGPWSVEADAEWSWRLEWSHGHGEAVIM